MIYINFFIWKHRQALIISLYFSTFPSVILLISGVIWVLISFYGCLYVVIFVTSNILVSWVVGNHLWLQLFEFYLLGLHTTAHMLLNNAALFPQIYILQLLCYLLIFCHISIVLQTRQVAKIRFSFNPCGRTNRQMLLCNLLICHYLWRNQFHIL